jgi:putative phosphoribosyl transferase
MTSQLDGDMLPFADRRAAGRLLAERLAAVVDLTQWDERAVVLALPRGGVAVAREVAAVLGLPLDVIVTRKIGYPPQPELGLGAIAEGLARPVYDAGLLGQLALAPGDLSDVVAAEQAEVARRVRIYRGGRPLLPVAGRCVLVVDDGLATGSTARAALRSLRAAQAAHLVLAVPVAPPSTAESLRAEADEVIILATPAEFSSVGEWYTAFGQLADADVMALLGLPPGSGRVGAAHAAAPLSGPLVLVQPAPRAVLLRPGDGVVQAFQAYRASGADLLGLALPDLPLRLALAIRAEKDQQVLTAARSSILPTPVRPGEHGRLPTNLRHGTITSTKLHQIVRYSVIRAFGALGLVDTRTRTLPVWHLRRKIQRVLATRCSRTQLAGRVSNRPLYRTAVRCAAVHPSLPNNRAGRCMPADNDAILYVTSHAGWSNSRMISGFFPGHPATCG